MERDDLEKLLVEHTAAWNGHDLDRLMSLFADDCVFDVSGGPEAHGRRFEGRAQVRAAFGEVFAAMPDVKLGRRAPLRDLGGVRGVGVEAGRHPRRMAAGSMSSAATS